MSFKKKKKSADGISSTILKKTVTLYSALWFDHSLHTSDVMILFLTTGQSKALHFLINASYEERQMVLSAQVRTLLDRNPISYL